MSHCIPCIGANRIRDAKSRKYILITFDVFVNRIESILIKILKEKTSQKRSRLLFHEFMCLWLRNSGFALRQSRHDGTFHFMKWRNRSLCFAHVFSFSILIIHTQPWLGIAPAPAPASSQNLPAFASALLPSSAAAFSQARSAPWTRLSCAPCDIQSRCLQYDRPAYRLLPLPNRIWKSF